MVARKALVVSAAVIVSVVLVAMGGYELMKREALKSCEVSLTGVEVVSIGLTGASLEVELSLHNPNAMAAVVDRAEYSLHANGAYLGDGSIQRTEIPPGGTKTIKTPFSLSYSGALAALRSYLEAGEVEWRVNGTAYFDTPLGPLGIPFDQTITSDS